MSAKVKVLLLILHVVVFIYGFQLQRLDAELSNINRIGWSIYVSRGAALCLAMDMVLILLPACRKLLAHGARLVHALFGWGQGSVSEGSYSSMVLFHKYIAVYIAVFTAIHVGGHCINFYRLEALGLGSKWSYHFGTWAGLTGYGMILLLTAMFVTAHRRWRHWNFELFWYTHHLFVIVMLLFGFHAYGCFVKTNDGVCRGYNSWRAIALVSALYGIDRLLRYLDSRRLIPLVSATIHPGHHMELCFRPPKHLQRYHPGQHVYLNVPALSRYQWHPFTITSSPIESTITLDIRQDGDWTCALGDALGHRRLLRRRRSSQSQRQDSIPKLDDRAIVLDDSPALPKIRVDGPYGGPRRDVLDFDHAVLIGTGTGITTFSGILRHIWFRHQITQNSRLQCLDLYWVTRDTKRLDWFKSLFSMDKTVELFRMGLIRIHIYFTASSDLGQFPTHHSSSLPSADHHHHHHHHKEARKASNANKRARAAFLEQLVRSTKPLNTSSARQDRDQGNEQETVALAIDVGESDNEDNGLLNTTTTVAASTFALRDSYSEDDDENEEHDELLSPRSLFPGEQLPPYGSAGTSSTISLATLNSPPRKHIPSSSPLSPVSAASASAPVFALTEEDEDPVTMVGGAGDNHHRHHHHHHAHEHTILGHDHVHFGRPKFDQILQKLKTSLVNKRQYELQQARRRRIHNDDHSDEDDMEDEEDEDEESRHHNHAYRSSWSFWPPFRIGKGLREEQPVRVGVFYSGSPALSKELERECKRISDGQIRFVFVTE